MEDYVADGSTESMRSLTLALAAGADAEDAMNVVAIPPELQSGSNRPFAGGLAARWQRKALATPGAEQVRRTCNQLDEFAVALADLAGHINDDALATRVSNSNDWSKRLWDSNSNASDVYNDVRANLAMLNQYRINMILKRTLADP